MRRTRTRTACLLATAALLVSASPSLASSRHDDPHPPAQRAPHVHQIPGSLAVVPSRTRLVTMPG